MIPPRRVHHVAELVGLDANRRKVLDDSGAPARLSDKRVTRIRLCWQITAEEFQRSRIYPREDLALARRHREVLIAGKLECRPVGPDGFPLSDEELARRNRRYTFREYLLEVYIPSHPGWSPSHRGNVESIGLIIADLFRLPPGDVRGKAGTEIPMDEITSDDGDRMIKARRALRKRGTQGAGDAHAVKARTEDMTWKLANAVFDHALTRTPSPVQANPLKAVGRRSPAKEIRSRSEEEDTAWTSAEIDLVADTITPHYRPLILARGRLALRPSEAAFLEPGDVQLDTDTVEVRGSFHAEKSRRHNDGKRFRLAPIKHREPGEIRLVPIAAYAPLRDALTQAVAQAPGLNARRRAQLERFRANAEARGASPDEIAAINEHLAELAVVRVFRNPDGSPLDWTNFEREHWRPALERAFVDAPDDTPEIRARKARRRATTFYELRHMAEAVWINEYGVGLDDVSRWAGTSVETLRKHYARRDARRDAAAWKSVTGPSTPEAPLPADGAPTPAKHVGDDVIDLARERDLRRGTCSDERLEVSVEGEELF